MIIGKLLRILIILTLSVFIFSCDLFFPAPVGRDNPDDPDVQIRNFTSVISGADSIVTIWDWREASPEIADSRIIEEIWIVHSENDPPTSRFPLDSEKVQKFDTISSWNAEWTNLKSGEEHYFALYAKEKGGVWLAPRHTKNHLDSSPKENSFTLYSVSPPNNPEEFSVYEVMNPAFTPSDVTNNAGYSLNTGDFLILNFNVYQQIFFDQFLFHLSNQGPGSDVNLTIYTLKKNLTNIVDWTDMVSDATIDYDSAITRQVTIAGGADQSIDISAVANRMFLYDACAIAIYADSFITFDIANWSIDTHFWGNY